MADCAAVPTFVPVPSLQRSRSKTKFHIPRSVHVGSSRTRECILFGNTFLGCQLWPLKVQVISRFSTPSCIAPRETKRLHKRLLHSYCLGALTSPENIVPSSLVSYADEVLLVVSVIFAYMAGAIPQNKVISGVRSDSNVKNRGVSSSIADGRSLGSDTESKSNDSWTVVGEKLLDALSANEHDDSFSSKAAESKFGSKTCPLSLFALAEGPRLRLLSATLQQLQKEVSDISLSHEVAYRDVWLVAASEVIKQSIQPACSKWLAVEVALDIGVTDMKLINIISEKLNGDDSVLQKVNRSGKAELYADLLFFLRYGCLRTACCYDSKFLPRHGIDILEDMVITLADGIASIYLELISVDSNMSTEINTLGLTLCSLSTRELQKLRNEVALNQWLLQNFESVVSMYEDRFELSVICRQKHEEPLDSQSGNFSWWKKFTLKKSAAGPSLNYVMISPISLPVRRTKELRALNGWRYYFSLFLEFSDITMPLVITVFTKVRNAVSFFLTCMIGRSLGLIFTGVRQSLGWR